MSSILLIATGMSALKTLYERYEGSQLEDYEYESSNVALSADYRKKLFHN